MLKGFTKERSPLGLAVLAVLIIASLVGLSIFLKKIGIYTRDISRYNDARSIEFALEMYQADKGYFPPTPDDDIEINLEDGRLISIDTSLDGEFVKILDSKDYKSISNLFDPINQGSYYFAYASPWITNSGEEFEYVLWYRPENPKNANVQDDRFLRNGYGPGPGTMVIVK